MNANNATTNAPTMNAPRVHYLAIDTRGTRRSEVHYYIDTTDGMKKARDYLRRKAREGYRVGRVYTWTSSYDGCIMGRATLIHTDRYVSITPGYNEGYVGSLSTIATFPRRDFDGFVWLNRVFIDTPTTTASIQYDAPIGPEPVHDEPTTTLNAVEECTKYCPTAIDAVKVAMTLDAPISIRTGIKSFEIVPNGNGSASGRIIYHGTYAHGGIDLGTLNAVDIREHGVALQYMEEDGTPDEFFIQAVTIKSITALNTGRDIFVRGGAN